MYVRPISTRLFRGMLTPAIRAIPSLPLPLLVTGVLADHEHPPVAADDLALLAHRLDRGSYLHVPFRLAVPKKALTVCPPPLPSSGESDARQGPPAQDATKEHSKGERAHFARADA